MKPLKERIYRSVFVIRNHTLKEAYFGSTSERIRHVLSDVRHHRLKKTKHWDWKEHDIRCRVLSRRIFAPVAVYRVRNLKKDKDEVKKGWKII